MIKMVGAPWVLGLKKKKELNGQNPLNPLFCNGRGDRIRTYDPLLPKQLRYQAAPRPVDSQANTKFARCI